MSVPQAAVETRSALPASTRVAAVGGPPTFRPTIARALGAAPERIDWLADVAAAEAETRNEQGSYAMLVLSPLIDESDAAELARVLTRRAPGTAVVVVRDQPPDGALPRLVRAGVRDVVDLSRGAGELEEALRRALDWSDRVRSIGAQGDHEPQGHIVSVFSTKGGTGKTFLATNLAAAIAARTGSQTAIIDLDLDFGDVFAYYGKDPRRSLQEATSEVVRGAHLDDLVGFGTELAEHLTGFGSPPDPSAEEISAEAMSELFRAMRSTFPFTVVDATCDYSDHVLAALDQSDEVCLITALDVISVRHLSMGMHTLESLGVPRERMRVVLNRADSKVELTPGDIERALGIEVYARIPSSLAVPRSINRAQLLWFDDPRSSVAKSIGDLADRVVAEVSERPAAGLRRTRRGRAR